MLKCLNAACACGILLCGTYGHQGYQTIELDCCCCHAGAVVCSGSLTRLQGGAANQELLQPKDLPQLFDIMRKYERQPRQLRLVAGNTGGAEGDVCIVDDVCFTVFRVFVSRTERVASVVFVVCCTSCCTSCYTKCHSVSS